MKPGSLVVVLPLRKDGCNYSWLPIDDGNTPYVVRDIVNSVQGPRAVVLEEGIILLDGVEHALPLDRVREIQGPGEVNVEEIVEESICEPA